MKNKRSDKIFLLILLFIFIGIGLLVRNTHEGLAIDLKILEFIHTDIDPVIFKIMDSISFIGSSKFLIPAIGIVIIFMIYRKRYHISKLLVFSTLGSWILNYLLKFVFNRTRPVDFSLIEQGGLSYPSGHSMVSMSMYLSIAYLLIKYRNTNRRLSYAIALILVFIMGFSRLYLGVHWPTDIIGGFIMGYLYFRLMTKLIIK